MGKMLYIASIMARKKDRYEHTVSQKRAKDRQMAKSWFERTAEILFPSEDGWYTTIVIEAVTDEPEQA